MKTGKATTFLTSDGGPGNDAIGRIAAAIAKAEGVKDDNVTTLPERLNNPGDLKDSAGNLRQFATMADGWAALRRQIALILNGESANFSPDWALISIAEKYTGGDEAAAWASIVAGHLGVRVTDSFSSIYEALA